MRAIKLSGLQKSDSSLDFLSRTEQDRYGPEIAGALAEYSDTAQGLKELLGPLVKGGMPKAVATLNARRLKRLGYSHEMIVAGAMITLLNQPEEPWSYLERGLLARWSGKADGSISRRAGSRPAKLFTHKEALEELNRRGVNTRLDEVFEQSDQKDATGKPMWRLK